MKSWLRHATVLAMTLMCTAVLAQAGSSKNAPAPGSVEAQVAARFAEKSGGTKPDQVFKGLGGLFEVLVGGELYYVDAPVNFVIAGRMFDARTKEDLTQKRLDIALKVDFKALPMDRAIKTTRGNGSRVIVTFEDPNCPYCKRLWQNMAEMKDVTIYTFLYPILSEDSIRKSKQIWCSVDRAKAWNDWMVEGRAPSGKDDCDTAAITKNQEYGRRLGISGTPTMFFADGERVPGAMPLAKIEQKLGQLK